MTLRTVMVNSYGKILSSATGLHLMDLRVPAVYPDFPQNQEDTTCMFHWHAHGPPGFCYLFYASCDCGDYLGYLFIGSGRRLLHRSKGMAPQKSCDHHRFGHLRFRGTQRFVIWCHGRMETHGHDLLRPCRQYCFQLSFAIGRNVNRSLRRLGLGN